MWLFRGKDKTHYIKATAPTTGDGPIEVGTLWSDTTANLLKRCTATSPITFVSVEGGGGAPTDASYVVIGLNGTLTAERVLTAGSGISITDNGAGSTVVIAATGTASTSIARTFLLMGG